MPTPLFCAVFAAAIAGSCASPSPSPAASSTAPLSPREAEEIATTIRRIVTTKYDLSGPDVANRMMSIYADTDRIISATAGRITTTRDSLRLAVEAFWDGVGQFMVRPKWTWGEILVDALDRDNAVMTATYTVPHHTSDGHPHVIGGVWTAVWSRRAGRWGVVNEHLSDMPRPLAEALERQMARTDSAASRR